MHPVLWLRYVKPVPDDGKSKKGEKAMYTFCLTFTVNGKRTEQIVRAHTIMDARKLIEAQYQGCSIRHISTGHERM